MCASHCASTVGRRFAGGLPCVGLWISDASASVAKREPYTRVGEWLARFGVGTRLWSQRLQDAQFAKTHELRPLRHPRRAQARALLGSDCGCSAQM